MKNASNSWLYLFFGIVIYMIPSTLLAQGEANNWLISINHLVSFNSGTPQLITPPTTVECPVWGGSPCNYYTSGNCGTSISNKDGNLLLYSNGEVVFNSEFDTIQNGEFFLGDIYSNQSILIPKPGNKDRYFLITTPWINAYGGARYSEIDITLNNEQGGVIFPINNVLLSNTCQKVTAVYHANGKDIWLMLHQFNSNAFYAYLVTSNGINLSPIVSNTGSVHENPIPYNVSQHGTYGEMKFSTNGKRLAVAIRGLSLFEIFDFNNETGVVYNPISIPVEAAESVEFSPDGDIAYVGTIQEGIYPILNYSAIYQIDLLAGDSIAVVNSKIRIDNLLPNFFDYQYYLQVAPNGKIYFDGFNFQGGYIGSPKYIGAIQNPNTLGTSCNFIINDFEIPYVYVGAGIPQMLPNFFRSTLDRNILFANTCYDDSTLICTQTNTNFDSIRWVFQDLSLGLSFSIPNQDTVYHIFSEPGSYEITLKRYRGGFLDENKRMLYVNPTVNIDLGVDSTICDGSNIELILDEPFIQFAWVNNISIDTILSDTANISTPGTWWPTVTNYDEHCGVLDSIEISILPDQLDLGNDTSGICISNPLTLSTGLDSTLSVAEVWSTGDTTSSIIAISSNYYYVEVTHNNCTFYDTIQIQYDLPLIVNLPDTSYICDSIPEELSAGDFMADFQWSPGGETSPEIMVDSSGVYSVTASNGCGDFSDTTLVLSLQSPSVFLGNDTSICFSDSLFLDATNQLSSYTWSTGDIDSSIFVSVNDTYLVTVTNACDDAFDDILVEIENPVSINLGNDTTICFGEELLISPEITGDGTLLWSTSETTQEITVNDDGEYILSITNVCGEFSDTLNLNIQINDFSFSDDTLFVSGGDSIFLIGPDSTLSGVEIYDWSTGDSTQLITVSEIGTYWLTVTDTIGCEAIDSLVVAWPYSVSEFIAFNDIIIYPNPTLNEIVIEGVFEGDIVQVLDLLGNVVARYEVNQNSFKINLGETSEGVYLLRIERGNYMRVFKVLKL